MANAKRQTVMKFEATYILLVFLTLLSVTSCGQAPVVVPKKFVETVPKEFVETVPPNIGSDEWYTLNHSEDEFGVKIVDGKLVIEKAGWVNQCELNLSNGKLVGVDKGEWGGTLTFEPTDTTKSSVEIKRGNVKFIFTFKEKIYFIEGLAHLSMSFGALFELENANDSFAYKKLIDFEDAPEAFTIYQDKFLIATHRNFYVIQEFKKLLLFEGTFWSGLYPNSIAALDDENVFVGIRGGIVKLDLTTKTLKFYKKEK